MKETLYLNLSVIQTETNMKKIIYVNYEKTYVKKVELI